MEDQEEYLVSFANMQSGLIHNQSNFLDSKSLKDFYNKPYKGVPLCLPKNIKYFNYKNAIYFKIDKKKFSEKIFGTTNLKYIGNKKYFRYGCIFASNVSIKKKYQKKLNAYIKKNLTIKKKISHLVRIRLLEYDCSEL